MCKVLGGEGSSVRVYTAPLLRRQKYKFVESLITLKSRGSDPITNTTGRRNNDIMMM